MPLILIGEGPHISNPFYKVDKLALPACHTWAKIRPPLACTLSTILFQPSTYSFVNIPGSPGNANDLSEIGTHSDKINPASALRP